RSEPPRLRERFADRPGELERRAGPTRDVLEHTAVAARELRRMAQPETRTAGARRVLAFEQVRDARGLDAGTFVLHAEETEGAVLLDRHADGEPAGSESDGVQ